MLFYKEIPPGYAYDVATVQAQVDAAAGHHHELNLDYDDRNTEPVFIIGGGPTLKDDVGGKTRLEALDERRDGIKVLAGSSHRLLDQNGLKMGADICVMNSPGEGMKDVVAKVHPGLAYYMASLSHPAFFEKLDQAAANTHVWHAYVPGVEYPEDATVVGPGSTSATAAVVLLMLQGYKEFEFFGVDGGTFEHLPEEYLAYDHTDFTEKPELREAFHEHVVVEIGGGRMKVATNLWRQAEEMAKLILQSPDCKFTFHGKSLNNLVFNQGMTAKVVYDAAAPAPEFPQGPV